MHINHKLIPIENEKELKKENITLDYSSKDFNEKLQKLIYIKKITEKELEKIDELYNKVDNEITKSFEDKYNQLKIEENNLKDRLKNEVTKIKEKIEIFYSECNELIRINERINKGIKSLEKEESKNMIKILSYLSKINKNKKGIEMLFQKLIKSANIIYNNNQNNINFEEYYFNGIQIPKDFKYKYKGENTLELSWKIDNIKFLNINNNDIKYKVEIKKDNSKDKYILAYEEKDNNCLIEKMDLNFDYDIRICCIYNDLIGDWSEIYKIKKKEINNINYSKIESSIIYSDEENKFIINCIGKNNLQFVKLYKMSIDGDDNFHTKCDNKGPTLCLFKIKNKDIRYGGYTSVSWDSFSGEKKDENALIFSINSKKMFKTTNSDNSIFCRNDYGPFFGGNAGTSKAELWFCGKNNCGFYNTKIYKDLNKDCTQGLKDFGLDELEVFQVNNCI